MADSQKLPTDVLQISETCPEHDDNTSPDSVDLTRRKEAEVQLMIPRLQTRKIDDINLTAEQYIDIGRMCFGCCILTDGRMAFTNKSSNTIQIFNTSGTEEANIKPPGNPFDVIEINNTTLAVSCSGGDPGLYLIDTRTASVIKSLLTGDVLHGIAVRDEDHLIYCNPENGIGMICISDGTVTDIVKEEMPNNCYIAAFGDNVIHTNWQTKIVTCHDINGEKKWSFKDQSFLRQHRGIATDSYGNIFVGGRGSDEILILSPDGQNHKEIQCGLSDICSLDYDKVNDKLLVTYYDDKSGIAEVMKLT